MVKRNLLPLVALVVGGLALLLALGLAGCSPSVEVAAEGYGEAQPLVDQAKADLAARLDVAVEDVVVAGVEATEFPDASLGVPEPGQMVAQVITPGYVIVLAVDGAAYEYHAAGERVVFVPAVDAGAPDAVVDSFYRWYLDYPGNVLADGAYRSSKYLTAEFIAQVDEIVASFNRGGYDPFLCAQDIPGDLAVGESSVTGEAASVIVHQTWNPGTEYAFTRDVTVSLEIADGAWKIAGVACAVPQAAPAPLPEGPMPTTPEGAVQGFYSWYLWYGRNAGNPLADGAYRSSEYLTWPLIERVDQIVASFNKGGYDPFLCAQDIPESFGIDTVEIVDDNTARVVVHTSFEGHAFILSLVRMGEQWAIGDITCAIASGGGAPLDGMAVVGWLGAVVSTPAGAQFDDFVVLMPKGAGEVGIEGADEAVKARIAALRDKAEPGKYAHFWGTLTCDVIDYGGCQLLVTRVRAGTEVAESQPVEGWEGTIVGNPPGSQFDDYFVLAGGFPVGYGIGSIEPEVREQLAALRDTGAGVRVWGLLRAGVPDAFGSQIDVARLEVIGGPGAPVPESGAAVDDWVGTVVNLPPGNQFGQYFVRDDGERFGIAATSESLMAQVDEVAWTGAQIRVWGTLYTGVPATEARQIVVERIELASGPAAQPRNLSSFATPNASSALPADRGGTYFAWSAVDGLPESAWVEGVPGPGIGESITLTFPGPIVVGGIGVDVGFDRDGDIFAKNNRLKRATATFSNGESVALVFSDSRGVQVIGVEPVETTFVQIVIEEVHPGAEYDDTCLAEIEVWGVVGHSAPTPR
jgi:hypothetical protein